MCLAAFYPMFTVLGHDKSQTWAYSDNKTLFWGRAEWRDPVEKGCRESDTESGCSSSTSFLKRKLCKKATK